MLYAQSRSIFTVAKLASMLVCLLALSLTISGQGAAPATMTANDMINIRSARVGSAGDGILFVLELDRDFSPAATPVNIPGRVYADLNGARWQHEPRTLALRSPILRQIRIAQSVPSTTRVVFDLATAATPSINVVSKEKQLVFEVKPSSPGTDKANVTMPDSVSADRLPSSHVINNLPISELKDSADVPLPNSSMSVAQSAGTAPEVKIHSATMHSEGDAILLVLQLDRDFSPIPVPVNIPGRVYVDLNGAGWQDEPQILALRSPILRQIRIAQSVPSTTRVVFDLATAATPSINVISRGKQLVFEVKPSSPGTEEANVAMPDSGLGLTADRLPSLSALNDSTDVALPNSGQVIDVGSKPGLEWLYGGSLGYAYYDSYSNQRLAFSQNIGFADPYIGLLGRTEREKYILEYSPTLSYAPSLGPVSAFHKASFESGYIISPHLAWNLSAKGRYGSLHASQLAGLGYSFSGGVPIFNPNSTLFSLLAGHVAGGTAGTGLSWQINSRQTLTATLQHSYYDFMPVADRNNKSGFRLPLPASHTNHSEASLSFRDSLLPRFGVYVTGHVQRVWNPVPCNFYGVGTGFEAGISRTTNFSLGAGYDFAGGGCRYSSSVLANGRLTSQVTHHTAIYVSAERRVTTNYLGVAAWQDTVAAGQSTSIGSRMEFSVDTGYLRSDLSRLGTTYQGYFGGASWAVRLTHSLSLAPAYRRTYVTVGPRHLNAGIAMIAIHWNPTPESISPRHSQVATPPLP